MSEVVLVKFKIIEGKLDDWLNWCEELKKRVSEVLETLKDEHTKCEACFLSSDKKHVYYFMNVENFERAKEAVQNSNHKIDKEHKKARKICLEEVGELKELFHFNNGEDISPT